MGFDYHVNEYMMSKPIGKPDWCPMKEIPEKFPSNIGDYYADGMIVLIKLLSNWLFYKERGT